MSSFLAVEDYLHPFKNYYRESPVWIKKTLGWAYSKLPYFVRYGRHLSATTRFLKKSQWWSRSQHRNYQWQEMQKLLKHAYNNVPYYRRVWKEAGVSPNDIKSLKDVTHLPLLTKEEVRQHKEELIAENYRKKLLPFNTGGSTGEPLEFYWERGRTRSAERAFMWRQWRWVGFEYGQPTAVLRGQTIAEGIHFDPIDSHLFLSGFDLHDETAKRYLDAIREFKPVSLQAYPSTVTLLAQFMKRNNEPPIEGLQVILCGSENLYPAQRALLEDVFQCRVYSWYGQGESVCLAGGCESSDNYHVYSEYGYTELINKSNQPIEWKPGAKGEIVATGFNNWAMPLIRYRTADVAVVGPEQCECGREYDLWEYIEGRKQEYIVAPDGRLIALTAFIFGQHYSAFTKIERLQIIQKQKGEIEVKLIVVPEWTTSDEEQLRTKMLKVLEDPQWKIDFKYVESIELTERGKHRFVVQHLPLDGVWN